MLAILWAAAASFVVLAAMFGPLERLFPARPGQRVFRPAWLTDGAFFLGQYLLFNLVAIWGLIRLTQLIGPGAVVRSPWWEPPAVIAGDLLVYGFHRACHRFTFLWRFHAVHHSSEHLDWLAAHREHPVDGLLTQLAQNLPAVLLGVAPETLASLAVFRGVWAIFVHSNVRLPLGPLRWLVGAPELHHWHHARSSTTERTTHNFANLAPWIDLLFGTHHLPDDATYPLGLSQPWPRAYLAQLAQPFVELAHATRRRLMKQHSRSAAHYTRAHEDPVRVRAGAGGRLQ